MNLVRFDIAVAGDRLAARMVAALLAKHGKRVVLLTNASPRDPWQQSSLLTEKLLGMLSGQEILASNQPLQVLAKRARVTIDPGVPLASELNREFGADAPPLKILLDELERYGTHLEELCWRHGGLPTGSLRDTVAWQWLCVRRKLPLSRLRAPLTSRLHGLSEPAGEWLRDLFQGLSLQPVTALSVADAALLWAQTRRAKGVDGEQLDRLLRKRFEQFHGTEIALDDPGAFEYSQGHWNGRLPDGKRLQATQLILGNLDLHLPGHGPLPVSGSFPAPRYFTTSPLDGQISALLTKRVIVGGPLPVRMSLSAAMEGLAAELGVSPAADEAGVRAQLETILPFARYSLTARPSSQSSERLTPRPACPLFKLPIQLGTHLWCADETRLLPQLGTGGAALLAWTLAQRIDPTLIVRHD